MRSNFVKANQLRRAGIIIPIYDDRFNHVDCMIDLRDLSEGDSFLWIDYVRKNEK